MAGIKVTDLPVLGAAAPDDVMYIVDTSTNTSKQIAVEDIVGGIPDIESGQWNPTPTNIGGTNPIVTIIFGNYSRVGGVVTCSLFFEIEMDAAENTAQVLLDLPIASNFTAEKNAFGIISYSDLSNGELGSQGIQASPSTDKLQFNIGSITNGFAFQYLTAMLQYVII
jgi:hypothetical protein